MNTASNPSPVKSAAAPRLHKKASATPAPAQPTVSEDEIAKLAYSFWEARGFEGGSPEQDWLRAEEQLRGRTLAATA